MEEAVIHKNVGTFDDNRIGYIDLDNGECIYAKALCDTPWVPELAELDLNGATVNCRFCLKLMEAEHARS